MRTQRLKKKIRDMSIAEFKEAVIKSKGGFNPTIGQIRITRKILHSKRQLKLYGR